MAFDPTKDQTLWQSPDMSPDKMFINIKQYANYPPKVEFARIIPTQTDPNAVRGAGRLSKKDWDFLKHHSGTIDQLMTQYCPDNNPG